MTLRSTVLVYLATSALATVVYAFGASIGYRKGWNDRSRETEVLSARPVGRPSRLQIEVAGAAVAVLAVAVLVVPTSAAIASSLPGQPLWRAKLGLEQVQLAMADDERAKARLHLEFAEQRLSELAAVGSFADPELIERVSARVQAHARSATEGLGRLAEGDATAAALSERAKQVMDQQLAMSHANGAAPAPADPTAASAGDGAAPDAGQPDPQAGGSQPNTRGGAERLPPALEDPETATAVGPEDPPPLRRFEEATTPPSGHYPPVSPPSSPTPSPSPSESEDGDHEAVRGSPPAGGEGLPGGPGRSGERGQGSDSASPEPEPSSPVPSSPVPSSPVPSSPVLSSPAPTSPAPSEEGIAAPSAGGAAATERAQPPAGPPGPQSLHGWDDGDGDCDEFDCLPRAPAVQTGWPRVEEGRSPLD